MICFKWILMNHSHQLSLWKIWTCWKARALVSLMTLQSAVEFNGAGLLSCWLQVLVFCTVSHVLEQFPRTTSKVSGIISNYSWVWSGGGPLRYPILYIYIYGCSLVLLLVDITWGYLDLSRAIRVIRIQGYSLRSWGSCRFGKNVLGFSPFRFFSVCMLGVRDLFASLSYRAFCEQRVEAAD